MLTIAQQMKLDAAAEMLRCLQLLHDATAFIELHGASQTALDVIEARVQAREVIAKYKGHWPNSVEY